MIIVRKVLQFFFSWIFIGTFVLYKYVAVLIYHHIGEVKAVISRSHLKALEEFFFFFDEAQFPV